MATEIKRIQLRRDTLANWTTANPVLAEGEYGYETDTGYERIGDGSTAFLSLPTRTGALNGKISLDSVSFDTGAAYVVGVGEMAWNAADETMDLGVPNGVVLQIGQETHMHVKAAETILDGEVVYASGAVGGSGKIEVSKYIANATIDELYVIGIATHDITSGSFGKITIFGAVRGVATDGAAESETWIDGTVLYASPTTAGKMTNVLPEAPNQAIPVAMVVTSHASNGTLFSRPSHGYHIGELHDVHAPTPSDGDVLVWETNRWVAGASVGKQTISVPADGLRPTTTNGAESGSEELSTNDVPIAFLAFDDSTEEYAGFYFRTPKSYNGGTITVEFEWYCGVTTGNVIWGAQAVCVGNDDPLDVAYGTAQEVTDGAGSAANKLQISAMTAAITVAAAAAEEIMMIKIYRKAADGGDTLVGDAKIINVTAIYTTNAPTDN